MTESSGQASGPCDPGRDGRGQRGGPGSPAQSPGCGSFYSIKSYFMESDGATGLLMCERTSGSNHNSDPSERHV